jgi:hypothetical protein
MLSNISALFSSSVKLRDETTDGLRFYHDPFKSSFFALRKDNNTLLFELLIIYMKMHLQAL